MEFTPYTRKAQYYETDAMAIVHHSNYIRWFEEARIDYMDQMGYGYRQLEADGMGSLLLDVQCSYHKPVRFGDAVRIDVHITECRGVRMRVRYEVYNQQTGALCCTGETCNCFLNSEGKPVALKRHCPALYQLFVASME